MPSFFLTKLAKVWVRNIAFITSVKILEHRINLIDLVLNPEMVETFLELCKTDTIVKVYVEVTVGLSNTFESLRDLDPEQVKHTS